MDNLTGNGGCNSQKDDDTEEDMGERIPPHDTIPKPIKHSASADLDRAPKRVRTRTESSIHAALESKPEGPWTGLLMYFSKATNEEHQQHLNHTSEEVRNKAEEMALQKKRAEEKKKVQMRSWGKERKGKQQARIRNEEILAGLRSPGGTRHRVNSAICFESSLY